MLLKCTNAYYLSHSYNGNGKGLLKDGNQQGSGEGRLVVPSFDEENALSQFFSAQEELLHNLKHFGKLDLYEIKKIGGDIGVPTASDTNERTTPFKKKKFEGSASLCTRPHKIIRTHPDVVRDFSWDTKEKDRESKVIYDEPSEDSSDSTSCNEGGFYATVYKLPRYIDFERGSFDMGTLRFKATIEIDKPLFSGFFMKRESIKDLWVQYKYEKLPKFCLKCGIISHEQKFCFKPPTVIKDSKGVFFPLFGLWMKHDNEARWPFSPSLPKWFEEWIVQKRLTVDNKFKQLWKMDKSMKAIDSWEARETRRFPMVSLPGIGKICPFEDTTNLVVKKSTVSLPLPGATAGNTESDSSSGVPSVLVNIVNKEEVPASAPVAASQQGSSHNGQMASSSRQDQSVNTTTTANCIPKMPNESNTKAPQSTMGPAQSLLDPSNFNPYTSLLGSQAQTMSWPSQHLWEMGFKTLTGLGTVDKFMREPSIFNPLFEINDF
ncbi:hypothetical protein F8388_014529 [Cannabis sativa]|uniref:Zinc knuckle CX2CX4HX4C domain-containing protein n=1 Tax=Cannabis sativa TaxID=3483 RepID=A0A7J6FYX5_CANSA|nr:hypothetical protein F8388_014529 [Cannabis sativa]